MSWLDEAAHFNGTLFRLPLRTPSQASKSEISSKPYDKKEVALTLRCLPARLPLLIREAYEHRAMGESRDIVVNC